tara:strand:- start:110 stop:328 length:219 start_codon:yes stop_codon:yes gene_type:complete
MSGKEYLKFEGRNDIQRDPYSKAVINKDMMGYMAAKKRKDNQQKMDKLESEMGEIKELLNQVLSKMNEEGNR